MTETDYDDKTTIVYFDCFAEQIKEKKNQVNELDHRIMLKEKEYEYKRNKKSNHLFYIKLVTLLTAFTLALITVMLVPLGITMHCSELLAFYIPATALSVFIYSGSSILYKYKYMNLALKYYEEKSSLIEERDALIEKIKALETSSNRYKRVSLSNEKGLLKSIRKELVSLKSNTKEEEKEKVKSLGSKVKN